MIVKRQYAYQDTIYDARGLGNYVRHYFAASPYLGNLATHQNEWGYTAVFVFDNNILLFTIPPSGSHAFDNVSVLYDVEPQELLSDVNSFWYVTRQKKFYPARFRFRAPYYIEVYLDVITNGSWWEVTSYPQNFLDTFTYPTTFNNGDRTERNLATYETNRFDATVRDKEIIISYLGKSIGKIYID